jgi:phage gpG-like protein
LITVTLEGDRQLIAKLSAMPNALRQALVRKANALALKLEALVKSKLNGQVLHVRTGALRRSIFEEVTDTATSVTGRVASSGDVKYAAIHEFGGQTKAHVIYPAKANALAFMIGGKKIFAKKVNHPGSKIPARPYMVPSLQQMKDEIVRGLNDTVLESVKP